MKITNVEKNRKNPDMLNVFIDNVFAFSIMEEDYLALGLYDRENITEEEITDITNNINCKKAKSHALKYLISKMRTEKEIREKLLELGFDKETVNAAVEDLKSLGYINDRIYVQKYLYDRTKLKPKSKKMLRYELQQKGIDDSIIDEVLSEWKMDDEAVAANLVRRKFGKYDLNEEKIKRRVYNFLRNRGYSFEVIKNAIDMVNSKD